MQSPSSSLRVLKLNFFSNFKQKNISLYKQTSNQKMSNFFIRIEGTNQQYHFGELSHSTILNLCGFMRVRQFPQEFFSDMEATSELIFYLTSATRGEVHIGGELVYRGEFHDIDSYEYLQNISQVVNELREQRTELEEEGDELAQDVTQDSIENFNRDIDFFGLFDEFLDLAEERAELEENNVVQPVDELAHELAQDGVTGDKDSKTD
jgi:hypothetical protein